MKVLITGITGFAGSHLADYILENHPKVELHGAKRWHSRCHNIQHIQNKVMWHNCDLLDSTSVYEMIKAIKPDCIFHLGAQSYVSESWDKPRLYMDTNIGGTINVLEAIRHLNLPTRIHIAGSGEEYGLVYPEECPITETNQLRPVNPYAVSKVAQDMYAQVHHQSYGTHVVVTRTFNHIGPRRDKVFAFASFAWQIAMIERDRKQAVIEVGRLSAKRDYTHVKDIARAYWLALERGRPGCVYCISSGDIHTVQEGLDKLLELSTVKDIAVVENPKFMRPTEVPLLHCEATDFKELTGWQAKISFDETIDNILNYWRDQVIWGETWRQSKYLDGKEL